MSSGAVARTFALDPGTAAVLDAYVELLAGYGGANVTGVRGRDEIATRLLGDSLALLDVAELLASAAAEAPCADLGAGAGIPGIPLALALPSLSLTLVESVGKKCRFLGEALAVCGLSAHVRVACERSERFASIGAEGREAFAVVCARALGPLATVVELAAPLLAGGGVLLASKTGRALKGEGPRGEAAGRACGLAPRRVVPLLRSPLNDSVCAVFEKVSPTPEWLPRRDGLARSRPLGG